MTIIRSRGPLGALALSLVSSPAWPRSSFLRSSATTWCCAGSSGPGLGHRGSGRDRPGPVRRAVDRHRRGSVRGMAGGSRPHARLGRSTLARGRGTNTIEIRDVLVGEVWICGGQSNMEWSVNASSDPARRSRPPIDRRSVSSRRARHGQSAHAGHQCELDGVFPETVGSFTAVGYAFARHLQDELDVPVGLLSINWGGTRIEPWISPDRSGPPNSVEPACSRSRPTSRPSSR